MSTLPIIVPINLGCCPEPPRCVVCGPPRPHPTLDTILALIDCYQERFQDSNLEVAFFGGPPPEPHWINGLHSRRFRIRILPDLLERDSLDAWILQGLQHIELDVATFDDVVLRSIGRRYTQEKIRSMTHAISAMGISIGITLAPGLPGLTFEASLRDAEMAADLVDSARIHPVLVLSGSALENRWKVGTYTPLTIQDAIVISRAMLDILEARGVKVVRIGQQPGPDELGRVVAGPVHHSFRELVEARRVLDRLRGMLAGAPIGVVVTIRCSPADETRTRGPMGQHLRTLRAEFSFRDVLVRRDSELNRGQWELEFTKEDH